MLDYQTRGDGMPFDGQVWPELQRILAETSGAPPEEVRREAWLVRDLGLSW